MPFSKTLLSIPINDKVYHIKEDHLTNVRLIIYIVDSNSVSLFYSLVPLINNLDDTKDKVPWQKCSGFYWPFLDHVRELFPPEVQRKLDSYFKLKVFW